MSVNLGPHGGFIIAAYAIAALVLGGLAAWTILDERAQRRRAASLESAVQRKGVKP